MDEAYDIGVLLDGARLAEVGEHRALVLTGLGASVELREGDDGDVELLGQCLQRARDGAHLLLAAAELEAGGVHELQVVDHDEFHSAFPHEATCLCAELGDAEARGLVEIEGGAVDLPQAGVESVPFLLRELAALDLLALQGGHVAYESLHELHVGHLKGEYGDRDVAVDCHVLGHGEHEGGLAHGRARRNDHEVGVLPARRHPVELGISCLEAGEAGGGVGGGLYLLQSEVEHRVDLRHLALQLRLRDVEEVALGLL